MPAVVVTLGRFSMAGFMPGARISSAHGTVRPVDPETGAANALAFAMYHPAAALRTPAIERESYTDIASVPAALIDARARRATSLAASTADPAPAPEGPADPEPAVIAAQLDAELTETENLSDTDDYTTTSTASTDDATPQLTLF